MGSNNFDSLPDASSPSFILTNPTPEELTKVFTLSHPKWGNALSLKDYLARERYLTTVPLSKDGGITHWILTLSSISPGEERPILSSCESIRKRAFYTENGKVKEGVAHGIASVFTDPTYRGKGYASRMMRELGKRLERWQVLGKDDQGREEGKERSVASVLYSDIGKSFYAKHGWRAYESGHVSFKPLGQTSQNGEKKTQGVKEIGYHELAELCAVDERLLKKQLEGLAAQDGKRRYVALVPELDQLLWHMMREDFMTKHIFGKTPAVKGAVAGEVGKRVWALWMRGYYGGKETTEGNTLHILRVVMEDEENTLEKELAEGLKAIVRIAQREAAEWRSEDVQMWNPGQKLKKVLELSGIEEYAFVERDKESIASLMWYGEGEEEVDWVANEKYAWC
ncbi:hypothetical protein QBC35DRAFT_496733 [Podospora australis]|uniref:N-acetyltransferase domain-containing protein n=1 Tax=Podospora australis TaxID=1536484 RepID=A0AAN6WU72_9PEZI|nr:hypothetical protein QBC35DRAFT_496733 [Podospora australis]